MGTMTPDGSDGAVLRLLEQISVCYESLEAFRTRLRGDLDDAPADDGRVIHQVDRGPVT